jgi:hypothetical protein
LWISQNSNDKNEGPEGIPLAMLDKERLNQQMLDDIP